MRENRNRDDIIEDIPVDIPVDIPKRTRSQSAKRSLPEEEPVDIPDAFAGLRHAARPAGPEEEPVDIPDATVPSSAGRQNGTRAAERAYAPVYDGDDPGFEDDELFYDDPDEDTDEDDTEEDELFREDEIPVERHKKPADKKSKKKRAAHSIPFRKIGVIALALVVVAALFLGGFLLLRNKGSNQTSSDCDGVSTGLFTEGIKGLRENVTQDSIDEYLEIYTKDGYLSLTVRLQQEQTALQSLLPAEPLENDELFVSALVRIQTDIASNVLMDASGNNPDSAETWAFISQEIDQLESARDAQDIQAVLNGEEVTVREAATPTPEATAIVYTTLSMGDKNDKVLKMQTRLYELGFFTGDRDGNFGPKTATAVKLFQQAAGMETTGIADNKTLTCLYSDDAPSKQAIETPAP